MVELLGNEKELDMKFCNPAVRGKGKDQLWTYSEIFQSTHKLHVDEAKRECGKIKEDIINMRELDEEKRTANKNEILDDHR